MALSQAQKQQVINWLQTKKPTGFQCSVCGVAMWSVGDHIVTAMVNEGGGLSVGGPSYPNAFLICNNCGHTVYFNAVMMGLMK